MESTPTGARMLRFRACLVCRRRKLRCDATLPECDRCQATGQTCQYQDPVDRSRIKVLQDRIKEIEEKIWEIEQRRGRPDTPSRSASLSDDNELINQTLLRGTVFQAPFPVSLSNDLLNQALDHSCLNMSDSCLESNALLHRGPSDLSLPGNASRKLMHIFFQRKQISGFELHIGRVIESFRPGSSSPVVPALFNAMLLLGCNFSSDPELNFWENMFYERTKLEIEANMARAHLNDRSKYNSLYHLQAMVMLGQWFYLKGRLLEGHVYVTRATRFAVALGLHKLNSRIYGHYVAKKREAPYGGIERWSPRDPIELGEAINLWWSCLERDYGGIVLNGLPPSISLEEIKTVWPVALFDFENMGGSELSDDSYSVSSIFDPDSFHIITDISQDSANCIVAKGVILTYTAGQLDTERISSSEVTDEWWGRFEECDRAIEKFTQSIQKAYAGRNIEEVADIALAQTAVNCAALQLHGPLADYELKISTRGDSRGILPNNSSGEYSYTRCMEACRSIASTAANIQEVDTSYMQMFFGISWMCAAKALAKYIPRLRMSGDTEQVQEIKQQLALFAESMERILVTYPILALQAEYLRQLLP